MNGAVKEGLPKEYRKEIKRIIHYHKQVLQIKLGQNEPEKVDQMKTNLDPKKNRDSESSQVPSETT